MSNLEQKQHFKPHIMCARWEESWPEGVQTRHQCQPQLPWLWNSWAAASPGPSHLLDNPGMPRSFLSDTEEKANLLAEEILTGMGAALFPSAPLRNEPD